MVIIKRLHTNKGSLRTIKSMTHTSTVEGHFVLNEYLLFIQMIPV